MMDVISLINEALQIVYAFVPQELVIIILAGLVMGIFFNKEDKNSITYVDILKKEGINCIEKEISEHFELDNRILVNYLSHGPFFKVNWFF